MPTSGEIHRHDGLDHYDHQTAYVYNPNGAAEGLARPSKRRKVVKHKDPGLSELQAESFTFDILLNGRDSTNSGSHRQALFRRYWAETEYRIQSVLDEANEGTLVEVTSFVNDLGPSDTEQIPTGFIVTGPNIASQGLLFSQLQAHLRSKINGSVVSLRSGDTSNLKAALKQIIREATNQRLDNENDEDIVLPGGSGRKLLNYDLETLQSFVRTQGSQRIVVAFQDTEAFDTGMLIELIGLISSWMDRIPFLLLFGIATSVDLLHERLSRATSRCLCGTQFDVEQSSSVLELVFQKTVAGFKAPLRLGGSLISSIMERQDDHAPSVQSFTTALKYAYMCHFYGNPLSFLLDEFDESCWAGESAKNELLEAVRMLPSFQKLVEDQMKDQMLSSCRGLLEDDNYLAGQIVLSCKSRTKSITQLLRIMHVLLSSSTQPVDKVELYVAAFQGKIVESEIARCNLEGLKRMSPEVVLTYLQKIEGAIESGSSEMDLKGWTDESPEFVEEILAIRMRVKSLLAESKKTSRPVRSSYAIQSTGVRTTVIAQKVQLSYEELSLSDYDRQFTTIIDTLTQSMTKFFTCENPMDSFLHEVWIYNELVPYRDVFTPRPRHSMELALLSPHQYLNCGCCTPDEGVSSTQPATTSIYQLYLEAGSLINVFDLWRAFLDIQDPDGQESFDDREVLVLFYKALADLKLLGMVRQSKKKVDHLAKTAFFGL